MSQRVAHEYPGTPEGDADAKEQYFPPENGKKGQQNLVTVMDAERGPGRTDGFTHEGGTLNRQLKARHIQMISIGGVIGTGLFLGTGGALRNGGPLGLLLGYTVIGSVCFSVMACLGEMISHLPVAGGHITLARRFGDPALSFTMGWNYWYNWTIVLPAELSASAVLIHYWTTKVNDAIWITVFMVVVIAINLGGARLYGEMEFWFAIIKVLTISGLIVLGFILAMGGGPNSEAVGGFRYWKNPGAFHQFAGIPGATGRFLGFFKVLIQASFSYIGTEITAIAAGEAKNPRRNLPKAIRRVYVRILLFYILGTFIIGLQVPSTDRGLVLGTAAAKSPFVIAIRNAGIKGLPSLINACLLTSAWSAASSDLYTSSRALYGMAITGAAPRIFSKTTSWGLPWAAFLVGCAFSCLSYMNVSTDSGIVFGYFANMTAVAGLATWCGIFITFIRWHQGATLQGFDRESLAFTAPLMPYLAYYGLILSIIVILFNGFDVFMDYGHLADGSFDTATFVTSYLPVPLFLILYLGYKFWNKTKWVAPADMDFQTGSRDDPLEEEVPKKGLKKIWAAIM